ncbi:leucine-rich repeat-containing protein 75A isoform X1 [Parambassis ranga]|uniref:Leucine-rich repeat-containing protein 75A isoform X1 n=1 Tax=Parambassis ranga TaxID=210632 RepID=A0A6P7JKT9_9TELE|nr:leucine-rich repeat-containing protein 75A isoform X1 [Parambassis ranga]
MGAKQTKGQEAGGPSPQHSWKRTPTKERGDILASLMLKSGDRVSRGGTPPPPYQRRISMIQEMMLMAKQGKQDEATEMLKTLRQDLGMESTSLDDVLYRYASFRNLVDPITHDLIISLARYVHCPKTVGHTLTQTEGDSLGAMEKVCRQLTYHLSPHSQWRRQGLLKRKPQACLKAVLSAPPSSGALDLSGIPLTARDMERLSAHLQRHASTVVSLELGFSELTDEAFLLLLPTLASLPHLETLALNGNRLTRAILKELTDALKDPGSFPSVTWIDLGNNVDIFSLPQPFLVSLRKRCPKQGNLPTILEFGESQASDPPERLRGLGEEEETDDTNRTESMGELRSEVEEELDGEMEIEEMMEELLDFDREIQGKDEEESMWTVGEQRKGAGRRKERRVEQDEEKEPQRRRHRPGRRAVMAEDEDDTQSRSSRLSCSSQSQHSSGAVEPMRVEEDDLTDESDHLT